ncbi:MAG: DUF6677 family protein [Pirellula sp.]|jgi:hypothetical protein
MNASSGSGYIVHADQCEINLKNRYFASLLAFLIPGAGHFYQGRTNKAYLFSVCILGLFFFGLYLGKGRVVYASTAAEDFRVLHFPAQVCVGLPAFPAVYHFAVGHRMSQTAVENDFETQTTPEWKWSEFMAPPKDRTQLSQWHHHASAGFELGSLFTAVAGLLNLLVVFDAFGGPMPLPQPKPKGGKPENDATKGPDSATKADS